MVRDSRIKTYLFGAVSADNVGSKITLFTDHSLNGELLRIETFSNYTGSLSIRQSGLSVAFLDATVTSGTNKWETFSFTNTTGSFVLFGPAQVVVSGVPSGTANVVGPINILYR
jgi:hypothetical protein